MHIIDFISSNDMESLIKSANVIITHGGVGTIIQAINLGKKIIAVPRLQKYKEHVNDHQLQIIENFNDRGYIIGTKGVEEIRDALGKIDDFVPKRYESNNENFVNRLRETIINI